MVKWYCLSVTISRTWNANKHFQFVVTKLCQLWDWMGRNKIRYVIVVKINFFRWLTVGGYISFNLILAKWKLFPVLAYNYFFQTCFFVETTSLELMGIECTRNLARRKFIHPFENPQKTKQTATTWWFPLVTIINHWWRHTRNNTGHFSCLCLSS